MRFDEAGRDPHVRLDPRTVQPHRDAVHLAKRHQGRGVERVVDDDAVAPYDLSAEHLNQFIARCGPVGAAGDHDRDLGGGDVCQRIQQHWQQGCAWHRARDVTDGNSNRVVGSHEVTQGGGVGWVLDGTPDGATLVRQAVDIRWLDYRRPVVWEFDRKTGAAVSESDEHR